MESEPTCRGSRVCLPAPITLINPALTAYNKPLGQRPGIPFFPVEP